MHLGKIIYVGSFCIGSPEPSLLNNAIRQCEVPKLMYW